MVNNSLFANEYQAYQRETRGKNNALSTISNTQIVSKLALQRINILFSIGEQLQLILITFNIAENNN